MIFKDQKLTGFMNVFSSTHNQWFFEELKNRTTLVNTPMQMLPTLEGTWTRPSFHALRYFTPKLN
jgi:hypothetical protein